MKRRKAADDIGIGERGREPPMGEAEEENEEEQEQEEDEEVVDEVREYEEYRKT